MGCSRGKASPDTHTKLRLFADAAGYCQRPGCNRRLFVDVDSKNIQIAEMAHIVAASDQGPRAQSTLAIEERGAYENLILLCPLCHAIIDKSPDDFPDRTVQEWKRDHFERIAHIFGGIEFSSRRQTREAIEPVMVENRVVFEDFGPNNEYRHNPESELAGIWQSKVCSTILPNNRRLLAILDANRRHLCDSERPIVEHFRQHVADLEARHLGEGGAVLGRLYPVEMQSILRD